MEWREALKEFAILTSFNVAAVIQPRKGRVRNSRRRNMPQQVLRAPNVARL